LSGQLRERSSGWQNAQNWDESTECRNKSGVHANTPLNWSVSYKRFGLTHRRHSNHETVSNLTRRRKAGRLQDGIDRYLPISGHVECTVTRCWRESSAHPEAARRTLRGKPGAGRGSINSARWRLSRQRATKSRPSSRKHRSAGDSQLTSSARKSRAHANLVSIEVGRIRGARCGSGRPTLSEQEVLLLGGNRIFDRSAQAGSRS